MKIKLKVEGNNEEVEISWKDCIKIYLLGYAGVILAMAAVIGLLFWWLLVFF